MEKILLVFMLFIATLYSDNNIIILNGVSSADVTDMIIRGNNEQCNVSMDNDGNLTETTCLQIVNSKKIKILCTKNKKTCKTINEVRSTLKSKQSSTIVIKTVCNNIKTEFKKTYKTKSNIDLNSDMSGIFDQAKNQKDDKVDNFISLSNPLWVKNVTWLKWKIIIGFKNKFDEGGYQTDILAIANKKVDGLNVILAIGGIGWRGYTYRIFLVTDESIDGFIINANTADENSSFDFNTEKIRRVFPSNEFTQNDFAWNFRNIFIYNNNFYMLLGRDFDETVFDITQINTNEPIILCKHILPSFNCEKAQTKDEKAICNSPELSKLDNELNDIWEKSSRFLTGKDGGNLSLSQKYFMETRKSSHGDIRKIEKAYKDRINNLKNQLQVDQKKIASIEDTDISLLKSLNGVWNSIRYHEASFCGETGSFDSKSLLIDFEYPNVKIKNMNTQKEYRYKIIQSISSTYTDVFYKNTTTWGSCGGEINLPYYGQYHFIILKEISTNKLINMAYTKNQKGDSSFVIELSPNLDYELDKKDTDYISNQKKELYVITDGYSLERLQNTKYK